MYLDRNLGLRLLLSETTLLFDLSLYLDRTLAQRSQTLKWPIVLATLSATSLFQRQVQVTYDDDGLYALYYLSPLIP